MSGAKEFLCLGCAQVFTWAVAYSRHVDQCTEPYQISLIAQYSRVDIDDSGCWIWGRKLNKKHGYPTSGKYGYMHRLMYATATGDSDITEYDVCHKCDVPSCVNPDHLFKGTRSENMLDYVEKFGHWFHRGLSDHDVTDAHDDDKNGAELLVRRTSAEWREAISQAQKERIAHRTPEQEQTRKSKTRDTVEKNGHWTSRATPEKLQAWKDAMLAGRTTTTTTTSPVEGD